MKQQSRAMKAGFTLIELLVVVAILVALAGLLLPKLDGIVLKANRGVAANNISGVDRYIQTYRVLHNEYPNGFDSLLDGTGNLPAILNPELTGSTAVHTKLTTKNDLTDDNIKSLVRVGFTQVYDYDSSIDAPPSGQFGGTAQTLSTTRHYATLNVTTAAGTTPGTLVATGGDDDAIGVYNFIYPPAHPQDVDSKIIVVGFGRNNSAIGDIVNNAPMYPNSDPNKFYCHFLAVFEARPSDHRAKLKCVLGADGDLMQGEIDEYFSQGNANE